MTGRGLAMAGCGWLWLGYGRLWWREREEEGREREGAEKERVSGDCGGRSRAAVGHLERDGTAKRRETAGGERDGPRPRRKDREKEGGEKGKGERIDRYWLRVELG